MFEKDLNISFLLDFYGEVLSEKKREVMMLYYNEDLSLAEIAEQIGISRQGVRDMIKKSEEELFFLEEKLGLAKRFSAMRAHADALLQLMVQQNGQKDSTPLPEPLCAAIRQLCEDVNA